MSARPNSTWLAVTNRVLLLAGLKPITSAAAFNSENNSQLLKYQSTTKMFVQLCNDMLTTRATRHFAERRCPLPVDPPAAGQVAVYPLDPGISAEHIKVGSVLNVTNGAMYPGADSSNGALRNMDYNVFMSRYNQQSDIFETGPPLWWILIPFESNNGLYPQDMIRIHPIPDQHYDLQYEAKLNPTQLNQDTDQILFPAEYEYALCLKTWGFTNDDLAEGKHGNLTQFAQQAANEVRLAAVKPQDIRHAPKMMRVPGIRRHSSRPVWWTPESVNDQGVIIDPNG